MLGKTPTLPRTQLLRTFGGLDSGTLVKVPPLRSGFQRQMQAGAGPTHN